jgi:tmRNA-binding protein
MKKECQYCHHLNTWNIIITSVTIILSEEAYCMQTRKRTYDQVKIKRKTSWQKNRHWLVHNSEIDRMTCSVCTQGFVTIHVNILSMNKHVHVYTLIVYLRG